MARGFKTGGKVKGSKHKTTLAKEAAVAAALKAMANPDGTGIFDGDAHSLLMLCYKNEEMPIELRIRCAESALKFEKPALSSIDQNVRDPGSYIVRMPAPVTSLEDWDRMAAETLRLDEQKKAN